MRHAQKTLGIILTRRNIGEADRLLTVFTENFGKVRILAKGARKIKSKLAPHIEPLHVVRLEYIEGKTFNILTSAERLSSSHETFDDLNSFRAISYMCELTELSFQEKEPNKEIFQLLQTILKKPKILTDGGIAICHYFEARLLSALGFRPDYYHCLKCGDQITERAKYVGNYEGIFCNKCSDKEGNISNDTLKILRYMSGHDIDDYLKIKDLDRLNDDLESIITTYLNDVLPRKPRSLELC